MKFLDRLNEKGSLANSECTKKMFRACRRLGARADPWPAAREPGARQPSAALADSAAPADTGGGVATADAAPPGPAVAAACGKVHADWITRLSCVSRSAWNQRRQPDRWNHHARSTPSTLVRAYRYSAQISGEEPGAGRLWISPPNLTSYTSRGPHSGQARRNDMARRLAAPADGWNAWLH